jgi:hypothetical protein
MSVFSGDIRKQEVDDIMARVKNLTLAQMKMLYSQIALYHDSIVLSKDERWLKPEDPNWEKHL